VTLLGYEVIESPNNPELLTVVPVRLRDPFTHVGALLSYSPVDWLTVTAGPVVGWDVPRTTTLDVVTGPFALTPFKDFTANFNWITGPEQASNTRTPGTVLDWTATYTGPQERHAGREPRLRLGAKEASLVASGTRNDTDASWWGMRVRAYDWTEQLRTALRLEYFATPRACARPPAP